MAGVVFSTGNGATVPSGTAVEVVVQPDGTQRQKISVGDLSSVAATDSGSGPAVPSLFTSDIQAAQAQTSDQPYFVTLTGDPNGDFAGVNLLEELVKDGTGLNLKVSVVNPPATDAIGNAIASDAPQKISITNGIVNQQIIVDTLGYASFQLTTAGGSGIAISFSNDGVTFSTVGVASIVGGGVTSGPGVGNTFGSGATPNNFNVPLSGRFMKLQLTTAGSFVGYLRSQALLPLVSGSVSVAPQGSPGAAPGANPFSIAGIDSGEIKQSTLLTSAPVPLVRRILTDPLGRSRLSNELAPNSQLTNVAALNVQDTTQQEGQSVAEILAQILQELKVLNHQIYTLPQVLSTMDNLGLNALVNQDDPNMLRADPTLFNPQ